MCFAVRGFRVCVLLFEAFGSDVPKVRFREAQKIVVFVDSKGNVKQFFGSGFGRFRLVSRWCLGLFASRSQGEISQGPKDVFVDSKGNVKEFFGSGFGRFRLVCRFATVWQRVLLFEAFGFVFCCSRLSEAMFPRPDFARPKRLLFLGFQR